MTRTSGQVVRWALVAGSLIWASARPAAAAPINGVRISGFHAAAVVKVHRRGRIVVAPFTYIETGRRVVVEAPFTTVYVGRRGRLARAPFVNIWIPR